MESPPGWDIKKSWGKQTMSYETKNQSSLKRPRLPMKITIFIVGILCGLLFLPKTQHESPQTLYSGARGGMAIPQRSIHTCDHPAELFKTWHLPLDKLPKKEVLAQLPRLNPNAATQPDVVYDPLHDVLCAVNTTALDVRYIQPQPTVQLAVQPTLQSTTAPGSSDASSSSWSAQWMSGTLKALWGVMAEGLG